MKVLLYISAIVAVAALVVIAIAIIKTAKAVKEAMTDVKETMKRVELKVGGITDKADQLMNQTNAIADDANAKLQSGDGLAASAKELKESTACGQRSIAKMADQVSAPPGKYAKLMEQTTALSEVASKMYYKMKQNNGER